MLTYTVEYNLGQKPFVQKTLYIEGKTDSSQWEKLKTIFFDALNTCDHLIVNISKVEGFDYSFTVLICSIRRTANLLGKRLTIEGNTTDSFACVYECVLHSRKKECMFMRKTPCYLWDSSPRTIPRFPGEWKKRLAGRKLARKR
jgi:hypothetical protein